MSLTRSRAVLVVVLATLFGALGFATPAWAESYASSISASSTSVPVGTSVQLTATNDSSGFAAITICTGWAGTAIAENGHVAPGGSISHSVSESYATRIQFASFAGPSGPTCTSSADASTTVTWHQQTSTTTTTTVPATTTTTTPAYAVRASASNTSPPIDTEDTIYGYNDSGTTEHISLCVAGSNTPVAEGTHPAGAELSDPVSSATAGSQTWTVWAGPNYGCSGPAHSSVVIDWRTAPTLTAKPTSAGTEQLDYPNTTTLSWTDAKVGDAVKVIETSDNGTATHKVVDTVGTTSFNGSTKYSTKQYTAPGTSWVNDYQAQLVNSAGTIEARADFSFTWNGAECIKDELSLAASSGGITASMQAGECLPSGGNTIEIYWSATQPSGLIQPSLAPEVGSKFVGDGPATIGKQGWAHTFSPASPHNVGYYEAYLVNSNGNAIVACTGVVHLSTPPSNTYALDWTASKYSATVGASVTLTGTNDTNAGGAAGNPEDIAYCGQAGSTALAEGTHDPGTSLTTTVSSSAAGDKTYVAFASATTAKDSCSGTEAELTIDWLAKAPPPTPALELIPSNGTPSVGRSIDFSLVSTSSLDPEWLDFCPNGSTLVAAATRDAGEAMTSPSVSSASAGDVTYHAWASTTADGEGCHGVEASATVDWQEAPTTTTTTAPASTTTTTAPANGTTTTTVPASGTTTTVPASGTTTTVPASTTTTRPEPTTTVPASTTTTTAPSYYPT